jgi:hypothetical protein
MAKQKDEPQSVERGRSERGASPRAEPTCGAGRRSQMEDGNQVEVDPATEQLRSAMEAYGIDDPDFLKGLLQHISFGSITRGQATKTNFKFALAAFKSLKPRGGMQAMVAAQYVVAHLGVMREAEDLGRAQSFPEHDTAERTLNKLARTSACLAETYVRLQMRDESNVTVTRVEVSEAGQAIVGNVTHDRQKASADAPLLTDRNEIPMANLAQAPTLVPVKLTD